MQIFQTMEKQTLRNQNITSWCVLNIFMCHICKNDQPIPRHMDQKARMKYRKDCDEVFPGIIVGNGECIKDVRYLSPPFSFFLSSIAVHFNDCRAVNSFTPFQAFFHLLSLNRNIPQPCINNGWWQTKTPSSQLNYMLDLGVTHIINCAEQVHIRKWTMLMLMLMLMLTNIDKINIFLNRFDVLYNISSFRTPINKQEN